ncbi:hypothetical protein [Candidatus Proelusimicrobium excrementi]|uniref:hypothetical protein n=1 Tax=Candidatus Proelusimicrobium excrementi TaxID=3416222 RepID=UPI003D130A8C|nr:hypothetical protein [Clostridia bacterium]
MSLKIDILGTEYTINRYDFNNKPEFEKNSWNGYCDEVTKEIALVNMKTFPGCENDSDEKLKKIEKQTLRHEIIHAFFNECGLQDSTLQYGGGWAKNEEMVDWIALQFDKILKAFKECDIV